ncbi:hypothetical protein HM1_1777 [Heliomicrobium modesticaldum Ice1]|uniref:Uncharacterized protein n=1 Tax=Heliobacterium modesticaldum (strain ATCC 51547 / Ice1) TaxID=498761 RepID=B0TEU0_HELMI|nr:hypothetical protein HM1_1777 [Heliomicrobium modesticaldum Ice1]
MPRRAKGQSPRFRGKESEDFRQKKGNLRFLRIHKNQPPYHWDHNLSAKSTYR